MSESCETSENNESNSDATHKEVDYCTSTIETASDQEQLPIEPT